MIEVYQELDEGRGFRLRIVSTKTDNPDLVIAQRATWHAKRPMTEVACPWPLALAAEKLRAMLAAGAKVDKWDDDLAARLGVERPKEGNDAADQVSG